MLMVIFGEDEGKRHEEDIRVPDNVLFISMGGSTRMRSLRTFIEWYTYNLCFFFGIYYIE